MAALNPESASEIASDNVCVKVLPANARTSAMDMLSENDLRIALSVAIESEAEIESTNE